MRIADALGQARRLGVDRLDAQLLLAHVCQQPRTWLLAHDDEAMSSEQAATVARLLARRAAGEPLAYVLGECAFRGLMLQVSPAVLIPRPETEVLVDWALELLPRDAACDIVDLGTGSGAIALSLQQARPQSRVLASDASDDALDVGRANAKRHGLNVQFARGDWWAPLVGRRFALVVSNPPYVAADDKHLLALQHEPRAALTPEGDGLVALRRIVHGAPAHLLPGAWLLLEHGHNQAEAVRVLLNCMGFVGVQTRADLAGMPRCTGAQWPAAQ
jgi:release factor glutamine methyltransferase